MINFRCYLPDESLEHREYFETEGFSVADAVKEFAQHCYDNRDGWEWMVNGCELAVEGYGIFKVTVDWSPNFYVRPKEAAAPKVEGR